MKAVVLLSGGMDSATCLALAQADGFEVSALTVDYGQRHELELERARVLGRARGVADHRFVRVDLRAIGGSALTGDGEIPKDRPLTNEVPETYVPARNTLFLSLALGLAEVVDADAIYLGANAIDYSGYPDCRPAFLEAFERLAAVATVAGVEKGRKIAIRAPLLSLTKAEIVRLGTSLGIDFGKTLSCYDPDASGGACGHCDACQLRRRGFEESGISDPTVYARGSVHG